MRGSVSHRVYHQPKIDDGKEGWKGESTVIIRIKNGKTMGEKI